MVTPVPKKKQKMIEKKDLIEKQEEEQKQEKQAIKKEGLGVKLFKYCFGNVSEDLVYGPIPFLWRLYKY